MGGKPIWIWEKAGESVAEARVEASGVRPSVLLAVSTDEDWGNGSLKDNAEAY